MAPRKDSSGISTSSSIAMTGNLLSWNWGARRPARSLHPVQCTRRTGAVGKGGKHFPHAPNVGSADILIDERGLTAPRDVELILLVCPGLPVGVDRVSGGPRPRLAMGCSGQDAPVHASRSFPATARPGLVAGPQIYRIQARPHPSVSYRTQPASGLLGNPAHTHAHPSRRSCARGGQQLGGRK